MKMTREQVADLLLKAKDDLSNVVLVTSQIHEYSVMTLENMMRDIANGFVFKIKDNSVKEVTPALLGAKCKFRTADYYAIIIAVDTTNERIYLPHDNEMGSTQFNNDWQLVEE